MSIVIDDPETERLARELAERTGESVADVVRRVLQERSALESAAGTDAKLTSEERFRRAKAAAERFAELRVLDDRDPDDLVGYDEHGLPR